MKSGAYRKLSLFGLAAALLVVLNGCARLPPPDASNPIARVAVLPVQNFTTDMDGAEWVRADISAMVPTRYYTVLANDQVDQILRDKMGVTLGGQIDYTNPSTGAPAPAVVGQTLDVDGLMYCKLEDFSNLVTGFYNRRKVKAACRLVNAKTNDVVWEKDEEASHSELNLSISGAINAVKEKVVVAAINSALRANPLKAETDQVIQQMQSTLPSGPVVVAEQ